jgi:hypothetical protein
VNSHALYLPGPDYVFPVAFINIFYKGSNVAGVLLDNNSVSSLTVWVSAVDSVPDALLARVSVPPGFHTVHHQDPTQTVGVILYSVGGYTAESYSTSGSFAFKGVANTPHCNQDPPVGSGGPGSSSSNITGYVTANCSRQAPYAVGTSCKALCVAGTFGGLSRCVNGSEGGTWDVSDCLQGDPTCLLCRKPDRQHTLLAHHRCHHTLCHTSTFQMELIITVTILPSVLQHAPAFMTAITFQFICAPDQVALETPATPLMSNGSVGASLLWGRDVSVLGARMAMPHTPGALPLHFVKARVTGASRMIATHQARVCGLLICYVKCQ